jgi:hypothetical protein
MTHRVTTDPFWRPQPHRKGPDRDELRPLGEPMTDLRSATASGGWRDVNEGAAAEEQGEVTILK